MGDRRGDNASDSDLLNRLNALRKSHITLDNTTVPLRDPETDLAARLRSLRVRAFPSRAPEPVAMHVPVPAPPGDPPDLSFAVDGGLHAQLADLAAALLDDVVVRAAADDDGHVIPPPSSSMYADDEDSADSRAAQEEGDILARLLAEIDLESRGRAGAGSSPHLHLPAVPATGLLPAADDGDLFGRAIAARLAALKGAGVGANALALPSAPTGAPAARPTTSPGADEFWCAICFGEATVRCDGCSAGGTLFCARCWREGHVGEDAERGHAWSPMV